MATKKLQIVGGSILQSDWDETNALSVAYIKNKPNYARKIVNITVPATNWSATAPYEQTLSITEATSNSKIDIQADMATLNTILTNEYHLLIQNNNGTVKIYAVGSAPSVNLTLQLCITEVVNSAPGAVIVGNMIG